MYMGELQKKILLVFSNDSKRTFSTSGLVNKIFPDISLKVEEKLTSPDREVQLEGKREKARLHRKLLYHLNKLMEMDVLTVTGIAGKGEKYYALNPNRSLDEGYKYRKLVESVTGKDPEHIRAELDALKNNEFIKKYDSQNWFRKLNAVLLEPKEDLNSLYDLLTSIYVFFNDVIGINEFQRYIVNEDQKSMKVFLKKLSYDLEEFERKVNFVLDLRDLDTSKLYSFLEMISFLNNGTLSLIIKTNKEEVFEKKQIFKSILKYDVEILFQNTEIQEAPVLKGRIGPHTIKNKQWHSYRRLFKHKTIGDVFSNTAMTMDVEKFFSSGKGYSDFRKLVMDSVSSMLVASSIQRSKSDVFFYSLNNLNSNYQNHFYRHSNNHIKLTNFRNQLEKEEFMSLLSSLSDQVRDFCTSEETIFKSCGIPTRHSVRISQGDENSVRIDNKSNISSKKVREDLELAEELSDIFLNNYILDVKTVSDSDDLLLQLKEIFSMRRIPVLSFNSKGYVEQSLERYMG